MRVFVAVNLPVAERERLGTVLKDLRRSPLPVRWIDDDSLHITLKFLGNVTDDRPAEILAAIRRAARGTVPFDINIQSFGFFPHRGRANVLWVGVQAPPALSQLQARLEGELEMLGFAREGRLFHPHITIARAAGRARGVERAEVDRTLGGVVYNGIVRVDSVDLMRSHLGSGGARYETIGKVELR